MRKIILSTFVLLVFPVCVFADFTGPYNGKVYTWHFLSSTYSTPQTVNAVTYTYSAPDNNGVINATRTAPSSGQNYIEYWQLTPSVTASCSNGVQDSGEQGIDCGGICPAACVSRCPSGSKQIQWTTGGVACVQICSPDASGNCPPNFGRARVPAGQTLGAYAADSQVCYMDFPEIQAASSVPDSSLPVAPDIPVGWGNGTLNIVPGADSELSGGSGVGSTGSGGTDNAGIMGAINGIGSSIGAAVSAASGAISGAVGAASNAITGAVDGTTAAVQNAGSQAHNDAGAVQGAINSNGTQVHNDATGIQGAIGGLQSSQQNQRAADDAAINGMGNPVGGKSGTYDGTVTSDTPDKKDISGRITSFLSNSPLVSMIKSINVTATNDNSVISYNFHGMSISGDFGQYDNILSGVGAALLAIVHILSILIIVKGA